MTHGFEFQPGSLTMNRKDDESQTCMSQGLV